MSAPLPPAPTSHQLRVLARLAREPAWHTKRGWRFRGGDGFTVATAEALYARGLIGLHDQKAVVTGAGAQLLAERRKPANTHVCDARPKKPRGEERGTRDRERKKRRRQRYQPRPVPVPDRQWWLDL